MARACAMRSAMGAGPCDFNGLPGYQPPNLIQPKTTQSMCGQRNMACMCGIRDPQTTQSPDHASNRSRLYPTLIYRSQRHIASRSANNPIDDCLPPKITLFRPKRSQIRSIRWQPINTSITCKVCQNLSGGKKCFENIHLSFLPGVKIGVVGVNGAGKSTLMKIMAGLDKDYTGEAWSAEGAKVGYLPQEPHPEENMTVRENVMLGVAEKKAILDRYNELAMNYSDETADEMAQLQDQIDAENLWDLDSQIDVSMEALRCPPDDAMPANLSGGERRRVALCKLLLEAPDMLLLDEPTNHLDAETIAWLQQHLIDYKGTILIVTHDRYFLDDITGWILELTAVAASRMRATIPAGWNKRPSVWNKRPAKTKAVRKHWNANWTDPSGAKARQAKQKARINAYEELAGQSERKKSHAPKSLFQMVPA